MSQHQPGPFASAALSLWQNADALVRLNLLWIALSLPLVTAPPALAGLYAYTQQLACEKDFPTTEVFWQGFRRLRWVAWRWALLNLAALLIAGANLLFYTGLETTLARVLTWLWAVLAFNWIVLQGYVFPLVLLQAQPRLRTALRNALVLYLRYPLRALQHTLLAALVAALSTAAIVPWALFSGAALTLMGNMAVLRFVALERDIKRQT